MEVSAMADTISLSHRLSIADSLHISSVTFPIDAAAPPTVRSRSSCRTSACRTILKRRRRARTRRRSPASDGGYFGGDDSGFFGGFGGGRGWNSDGSGGGGGGFNWDDWSSSSSFPDDPAFDFIYEVLCWIVFSNCLHFAFKKLVRLITKEREKVPLRMEVC